MKLFLDLLVDKPKDDEKGFNAYMEIKERKRREKLEEIKLATKRRKKDANTI